MAKNGLEFYEIMNYPTPSSIEYFRIGKKIQTKKNKSENKQHKSFSRKEKPQLMVEYTNHIKKYQRLFKSLPFIQNVYLCNSITFNALHEDSDIDLTMVVEEGRIRTARFFCMIYTTFLGLKRWGTKKKKKRCLSFWLTENNLNLYGISLPNIDIYLIYWITHLVPIYSKKEKNKNRLIERNKKRIKNFLPNHPGDQIIELNITPTQGSSKTKRIIEKVLGGKLGDITEKTIKNIWLPITVIKKNKLPNNIKKNIIISDKIQKFHRDIREKVQRLYQIKTQNNQR